MTKGKDREDTFIEKLGRLEEAGKDRERSGLEELLVTSDGEIEDELPTQASDEPVFLEGFEDKVEGDSAEFEEEVSKGLSSDDHVCRTVLLIGVIGGCTIKLKAQWDFNTFTLERSPCYYFGDCSVCRHLEFAKRTSSQYHRAVCSGSCDHRRHRLLGPTRYRAVVLT